MGVSVSEYALPCIVCVFCREEVNLLTDLDTHKLLI